MTDQQTDPTPSVLEAFGATYLRLTAALTDAAEAQWAKGATPRAVDDTTERASGTVSDPTVAIYMDRRRQDLRAAVIEAESALKAAEQALTRATSILAATNEP